METKDCGIRPMEPYGPDFASGERVKRSPEASWLLSDFGAPRTVGRKEIEASIEPAGRKLIVRLGQAETAKDR